MQTARLLTVSPTPTEGETYRRNVFIISTNLTESCQTFHLQLLPIRTFSLVSKADVQLGA